jgi:Zn-dependent peptidase ImmA (M78 family)
MTWLTNECADAVEFFWRSAGELEDYPRSLERATALALPVALVKIPHLQLKAIETWLRRRQVFFSFNCQNRYVHGCLVAYGGNGIIFIDGGDLADQMRFTLAHEIAHFLLDYWMPRQKAIQSLGPSIAEVMDGLRIPSLDERVRSLLSSIPIGIHTDLLEREESGSDLNRTWKVEDQADKVALALLAPPQDVLPLTDFIDSNFEHRRTSIMTILQDVFGLPEAVAKAYGLGLLSAIGKGPSWAETLGLR